MYITLLSKDKTPWYTDLLCIPVASRPRIHLHLDILDVSVLRHSLQCFRCLVRITGSQSPTDTGWPMSPIRIKVSKDKKRQPSLLAKIDFKKMWCHTSLNHLDFTILHSYFCCHLHLLQEPLPDEINFTTLGATVWLAWLRHRAPDRTHWSHQVHRKRLAIRQWSEAPPNNQQKTRRIGYTVIFYMAIIWL